MDWSTYPNFTQNSDDSDLKYECVIPQSQYDNLLYDRAVFQKSIKWPIYYTIKVKFLNGEEWQKAWVKKTVEDQILPIINPKLFISFVDVKEYADVKIKFVYDGTYGGSLMGTECRKTGQYQESMKLGGNMLDYPLNRKFTYKNVEYIVPSDIDGEHPDPRGNGSVIKHEFGHVFGKWHEHQNPINNPIVWDIKKTLQKYMYEPPPWTEIEVYKNVIDKLPIDQADATSFDPLSIMMYKVSSKLTKGNIGFDRNYEYSTKDIEWLRNHSVDPNKNFEQDSKWWKSSVFYWVVGILSLLVIWIIIYKVLSIKK